MKLQIPWLPFAIGTLLYVTFGLIPALVAFIVTQFILLAFVASATRTIKHAASLIGSDIKDLAVLPLTDEAITITVKRSLGRKH